MEIRSWRNGGPSLDRGDAAPQTGVYALYTQYNVGGCGHDDYAVVQVVGQSNENLDLNNVKRFCKLPDNYRQGVFSFSCAAQFELGAELFPHKED